MNTESENRLKLFWGLIKAEGAFSCIAFAVMSAAAVAVVVACTW